VSKKRKIEVFAAGCPACDDVVQLISAIACPSCEVTVLDMKDKSVAKRAKALGIKRVPSVVVNGQLASCCAGAGPEASVLKAAGVGQPLP
jgi:hypothetical protein